MIAIIFIGTVFQMVLMVAEDGGAFRHTNRSGTDDGCVTRGDHSVGALPLPNWRWWTPCASPWVGLTYSWWPSWWCQLGTGVCDSEGAAVLQTDKIFAGIIIL
jgi:hypothetical protein